MGAALECPFSLWIVQDILIPCFDVYQNINHAVFDLRIKSGFSTGDLFIFITVSGCGGYDGRFTRRTLDLPPAGIGVHPKPVQ
jgi:hypothetical protein